MAKLSGAELARFEKTRDLNAELLAAGGEWVRKTEFIQDENGAIRRRVTRRDGTVETEADVSGVTAARLKSGLSQGEFAGLLGVSVRTLQEWEQGRRQPSRAARTLIKIASRRPEVLREIAE